LHQNQELFELREAEAAALSSQLELKKEEAAALATNIETLDAQQNGIRRVAKAATGIPQDNGQLTLQIIRTKHSEALDPLREQARELEQLVSTLSQDIERLRTESGQFQVAAMEIREQLDSLKTQLRSRPVKE
jgi:chaperonin cofactor prefoldin